MHRVIIIQRHNRFNEVHIDGSQIIIKLIEEQLSGVLGFKGMCNQAIEECEQINVSIDKSTDIIELRITVKQTEHTLAKDRSSYKDTLFKSLDKLHKRVIKSNLSTNTIKTQDQ